LALIYSANAENLSSVPGAARAAAPVDQPPSKAPEQGYVPEAWYPHEGGLLKYRVAIKFGEEPEDTMPAG